MRQLCRTGWRRFLNFLRFRECLCFFFFEYLSCRQRLCLCPFSPCCGRHPPYRESSGLGRSTRSPWSQKSVQGTRLPHASCVRLSRGRSWVGSPLQATTCSRCTGRRVETCLRVNCFGNDRRKRCRKHLPVAAHFHPQDVFVVGLLACATVVAVPVIFGHFDVQTLAMEGSRTGLAAQQTAPYTKTRVLHSSYMIL